MRRLHGIGCRAADIRVILAREVVEPVGVAHLKGNGDAAARVLKAHDSLHQRARSVLNVLPHRVQIGGELNGSGEDTYAVFALALAVKLLPPLCHEAERRLVAAEYLDAAAMAVKVLTRRGVPPCGVFRRAQIELLECDDRGVYDSLYVDARDRHRKQADRRQNTVSAADIVGNDEALPAFGIGQGFECAAMRVGRCEYVLFRGRAVLFLQHLSENAEGQRRFKGGSGFGYYVYIEVHVAETGDGIAQSIRRKAVSNEEYLRIILRGNGAQKLDSAARAEVRASYADNYECL